MASEGLVLLFLPPPRLAPWAPPSLREGGLGGRISEVTASAGEARTVSAYG